MSHERIFHQKMVSSFILSKAAYEDPTTSCFPMAGCDQRKIMRTCRRCGSLHDINAQPKSCTFHKSFFRVTIPAGQKGLVMGKGGSRIKEIINVSKAFQLLAPRELPEIWFQGGPTAVDKAFSMIGQTLAGKGTVVGAWDCCKKGSKAGGCSSELGHDTKIFFCVLDKTLVATTQPMSRPGKVFALDCEMVNTDKGEEVAMVTLLNVAGEVCFESFVKPSTRIKDYNTMYSGITPEKLDRVTTTLKDVQKSLLSLISAEDILVGHGLDNDLRGLHLEHRQVRNNHFIENQKSSQKFSNFWTCC